jgi:hypothetical protein
MDRWPAADGVQVIGVAALVDEVAARERPAT